MPVNTLYMFALALLLYFCSFIEWKHVYTYTHYHLVSKCIKCKHDSASDHITPIGALSRNSVMFSKTLQDCTLGAFLLPKSGGEVILKNLQNNTE